MKALNPHDILLDIKATKMQMYYLRLFYLCCQRFTLMSEEKIWFPNCWNNSAEYMVSTDTYTGRIQGVRFEVRLTSRTPLSEV